ncbi:MAG TPA: hypothetical protein VK830_01440 [Xanthomonadales bacterium]|nr:hypothetical protein [Xanthomonadales bacterium]
MSSATACGVLLRLSVAGLFMLPGLVRAVFENPDHDFPTRIAYQLTDAGQMVVDVQDPDGKGFSIRFEAVADGHTQSSR